MASFEEFVAEVAKRKAKKPLDADTASLKSQYGPGDETIGQAAKSDLSGLLGLDPTNPQNLPNIVHHGVPVALQAGLTALAGPEANPLMKMLAAATGGLGGYLFQSGAEPLARGQAPTTSGGESLVNFLLGGGAEGGTQVGGATARRITGKTAMQVEGAAAEAEAANTLRRVRTGAELDQTARRADVAGKAEAGALAGQATFDEARTGALQNQVAKRADVSQAAGEEARKAQQAALAKVTSAKDAVRRQEMKHSDLALANVRESEVGNVVGRLLGAPEPLTTPTIEQLTERVSPVRESVQRNVRGVFGGLSQKFNTLLEPIYDIPVSGDYLPAVETERSLLAEGKDQVSKKISGLMDQLSSLDQNAPLNVEGLPPILQQERTRLLRAGKQTPAQVDKYMRTVAQGMQGQGATAFEPPTVRKVDDIRKKLTGVIIDSNSSATDKRVANRLIQSIDGSLDSVLPPEVKESWQNLRREWHEANSVFSPNFRSKLFRATSPAEVADVLYGAASGGKASRALTVIGQTPKDEIPLLRSAFAERLTQGNVVKNVQGMDKRVFKALFNGTGFEDPKEWVEALSSRIDFDHVMSDPRLASKWNDQFQQGMKSLGAKRYQEALDRAEAQLKATPDPGTAMVKALQDELTPSQAADVAMRGKTRPDVAAATRESQTGIQKAKTEALAGELTPEQAGDVATRGLERPDEAKVRGEQEGMKTPLAGKRFQSYIEHRTTFHTALALASLGTAGGAIFHHPVAAALPLAYIASSKAAAAVLSNPKYGRMWYNALKSKTVEQAAFLFGRLAAASLTEAARSE